MLDYIREECRKHGRMPGVHSYRLMHAFVETIEALHAGDHAAARRHQRQWLAFAHKLLDKQLFDDEPMCRAVSISNPGVTAHGADGVTLHLATMLKEQRAAMRAAGLAPIY